MSMPIREEYMLEVLFRDHPLHTIDALGKLTGTSIQVTDIQGKTSVLETALEYDAYGNRTVSEGKGL